MCRDDSLFVNPAGKSEKTPVVAMGFNCTHERLPSAYLRADGRERHLDTGGFEPLSRSNARTPGASEQPAAETVMAANRPRHPSDAWRKRRSEHAFLRGERRDLWHRFLPAIYRRDVPRIIRDPGDVDAHRRGHPSRLWRVDFPAIWTVLGLDVGCGSCFDEPDHADHRNYRHQGRNGIFWCAAALGCRIRRSVGCCNQQRSTLLAMGTNGHGAGAV